MKLCSIEGCGQKHSAQGLCVKHYSEHRRQFSKTKCIDCGAPCTRIRCKSCAIGYRKAQRGICLVPGCGQPHQAKGYCKVHWRLFTHPDQPLGRCVDCGQPCWSRSGRCRPCQDAYRRSQHPICSVPGCERLVRARGLCKSHYEAQRTRPEKRWLTRTTRQQVAEKPCQLCGYSRTTSHVHRVVPERGYVEGNVVPLCSNCHREVHAGITPCPEPLQAP